MIALENLSVEERKPMRDGKQAILVYGETAIRECCCGCSSKCEIPVYIFDDKGRIIEEYKYGVRLENGVFVGGRELSNGVFISKEGNPFYTLRHNSDYNDC